jgi:hypothetical protein
VQCFYSDRVTLLFGRRERSCALLGADVIAETASQTYHCSPPATAPAGSGATYVMIMMRVYRHSLCARMQMSRARKAALAHSLRTSVVSAIIEQPDCACPVFRM